mmetsp:Transcript_29550/g.45029  ORF Transcript_29550/g.45029 Transcript_29550/m.45029 type:complete len:93 (+) Transcript_29550:557-835(+)
MLGINPYEPNVPASDPQRSSSLGLFNFGAAPPQAPPAPQVVEPSADSKIEQAPSEPVMQPPSSSMPGLFSGLNTSASEPKQDTPKKEEPQNT